jgi:HSP20 family protein
MKKREIYYSNPTSVYPGEYEPLPWQRELSDILKKKEEKGGKPGINIGDLPYYYRIMIPMPGFCREDFFVKTDGRILSIAAISKMPGNEWFKRDILLPEDVDTDFGVAEYRNGILSVCLFKAHHPPENRPGHIIVY